MEHRLPALIGGHMAEPRRLQHVQSRRDALGHVLGSVRVRPHGDQTAPALPEPGQQGGPGIQVVPPAHVHLHGVVRFGHLCKNGPHPVLVIGNGQLHPVPVDIPQGVDDVGQTVVAVGALGHQSPGVVQGGFHRPAAQRQIVPVVGEGKVPPPLHADPVVNGAQHKVQLFPALGQDVPGHGGVIGGGAQLKAQPENQLAFHLGLDGVVLGFGGGPLEGGHRQSVQPQQVTVVGDAELLEPGGDGGAGVVQQLRFTVRRELGMAVDIAQIHF